MEEKRYHKFKSIAKKITNNDNSYEDLLHDVLLQLSINEKWKQIPENEQIYFFTRTILNQYNSKNSYHYKTYKKFRFEQSNTLEQIDENYIEQPSLEWIEEILEEEIKLKSDNWYKIGLFRMYMQNPKIDYLNKKTKIPKYSIRNTIKEVKTLLKEKWEDKIMNEELIFTDKENECKDCEKQKEINIELGITTMNEWDIIMKLLDKYKLEKNEVDYIYNFYNRVFKTSKRPGCAKCMKNIALHLRRRYNEMMR